MNISMMDTYNLTWRLALVLRGLAKPHLLDNYEVERLAIARYLIDFDRRFSAYFTAKAETEASAHDDFVKAFTLGNQFTRYFRLLHSD
jgi:phenol 2-monooxygenase (NADPH)